MMTSAKLRYTNSSKVCFSSLLMLVYIRTKFGSYSANLADFKEGGVSNRPNPEPTKPQKSSTVVG